MQSWRNALQSKLSKHVDTLGVTLARFLFATPIAGLYLYFIGLTEPLAEFSVNNAFWLFVVAASLMQILATALMVVLFKKQNFAVGAGLAKSEALFAGVLGTIFFGSQLSPLGWIGILVGTWAVFILSGLKGLRGFDKQTVLIGLACGGSFALTSLFVREASLALQQPFLYSAAWTLFCVLCLQTLLLSGYIFLKQPRIFVQLAAHKKQTLLVSFSSCIGSIGWFSAMALQHVAYVKTLGQIEVLFTILISVFWLKAPVKKNELIGLSLISVAAILVMWQ